jgi:hypothetical protein
LKLRIGGGCGPSDEPFVNDRRERLKKQGVLDDVEFCPNLDRAGKQEFFRSLSVFFGAGTLWGGLWIVGHQAMASAPVVQPSRGLPGVNRGDRVAACSANLVIQKLWPMFSKRRWPIAFWPADWVKLGRKAVLRDFSIERMARIYWRYFGTCAPGNPQ